MTCQALACCNDSPFAYAVPAQSDLNNVWLVADPPQGGTVSGETAVPDGTPVTVTAAVNPTVVGLDVGVDMIFCLDESGSMGGLTWVQSFFTDLDAALQTAGIGVGSIANRYGLVGFGANTGSHAGLPQYETVASQGIGHKHLIDGQPWGNITDTVTAVADFNLATSGLTGGAPYEDAYAAIDCALTDYTWRTGVAKVIMFVTDEDRSAMVYLTGLTLPGQFAAIKAAALNAGVILMGVTSQQLTGATTIGVDAAGNGYLDDGAGGFTQTTGATTSGNGGNQLPQVYSTVTSAGADTLTDTTQNWTPNQWAGFDCRILLGTGQFQNLRILSNTADTLTLNTPWAVVPVAGDEYQIGYAPPSGFDPQLPTSVQDDYTDLLLDPDINGSTWLFVRTPVTNGPIYNGTPDQIQAIVAAMVDWLADKIVQQVSWQWDGWYNSLGALVSTDLAYTFTPTDDITLTARFTSITD